MTLASGSTFGPYQIIEPLGRGGMASVYTAYEPGLERHVALKVLPREFLHDEGFAERFQREARVVARLEHPNIIPIHNFGIEEQTKTPWMAMRLISGGTLSAIMKNARISVQRTVAILRGVAEALDYAHGKGVVHRDVKPQNILLDEAERVYLADFGIAKMVESSSGLTATGMISGTPQYMAPEQAMGGHVDSRADIYALGIVAYEMLTGRVPFAADTPVAVLMKHVSDPIPVPPAAVVPEPLVRAMLKALAKRPEDRWPSAVSFVNALEQGLGELGGIGTIPGSAPTAMLPQDHRTPRSGSPSVTDGARPITGAGAVPAMVASGGSGPYAAPAPYPVTPPPGTYPAAYPHTPAPGTYPGVPYPAPPGTYPPGMYPPGTFPPGTYPGYPPPPPRSSRWLVLGLVAAVVVAGIAGTIVLLLLIRPRPLEAPERPPVTMRSPVIADQASPIPEGSSVLPSTPTTMAGALATAPAARPPAGTPATATTPSRVAETTLPPTLPPAPEPARPATPAAAVFPGAGKVDMGGKFYEKTLAYDQDRSLSLDAQVGPLKVPGVRFAVGERKTRFGRKVDDLRVSLRAVFPTLECPNGAGEWEYKFKLELLDESGRTVDRFEEGGSCEDEVKTVAAEHGVLKGLVPAIRGVRVRFEAEKD